LSQAESIAEEEVPPPPPPKSSARLFPAGPQSVLQRQLLGDLRSAIGGHKTAEEGKPRLVLDLQPTRFGQVMYSAHANNCRVTSAKQYTYDELMLAQQLDDVRVLWLV
jgi:hypothetical protein